MTLVLTRKHKESITLMVPPSTEPTIIKVTLAQIRRQKSKLVVEAPTSTKVLRTEIVSQDLIPQK